MERDKLQFGEETSLWIDLMSASVICSHRREIFFQRRRCISERVFLLVSTHSLTCVLLLTPVVSAQSHLDDWYPARIQHGASVCGYHDTPVSPAKRPRRYIRSNQYASGLWKQGRLWIVLYTQEKWKDPWNLWQEGRISKEQYKRWKKR